MDKKFAENLIKLGASLLVVFVVVFFTNIFPLFKNKSKELQEKSLETTTKIKSSVIDPYLNKINDYEKETGVDLKQLKEKN